MLFLQRYQLKRLLSAGEINTFSGLQLHPEQEVYLHIVPNGQKNAIAGNLLQDLLNQPQILPDVIEVGELAGTWFVVTEPIAEFSTFREWLQKQSSSTLPQKPRDTPAAALPQTPAQPLGTPIPPALIPQTDLPPGEFTRLFARPNVSSDRSLSPSKPSNQNKEEGDFTRLFGTAKPEAGSPSSPGTAGQGAAPGEFDSIFPPKDKAKSEAKAPTKPLAPLDQTDWDEPLPPADVNEMRRFFNSPYEGKRVDVDQRRALHKESGIQDNPEPFREAGEFTRVFGPRTPDAGLGNSQMPPQTRSKGVSSASRLFDANETKPAAAEPQPNPEGGSYTKIIAPKSKPAAPVVSPQPVAAPGPEPVNQKLRIALIVVGAFCGVALLSVILFLIFRQL